jgi:hypothetical protein
VEYLNYETAIGDHDRIVLLFERCLISCANYESFWCKYARYLENYHKKNPSSNQDVSVHFQKVHENVEIGSKKATEEEEQLIRDVQSILNEIISGLLVQEKEEVLAIADAMDSITDSVLKNEHDTCELEVAKCLLETVGKVCGDGDTVCGDVEMSTCSNLQHMSQSYVDFLEQSTNKVSSDRSAAEEEDASSSSPTNNLRRKVASPNLSGDSDYSSGLPVNSGEQNSIDNGPSSPGISGEMSTLLSIPTFPPAKYAWQEAVRDVYKRACVIHCPKKPNIRLQWAAFEEELGEFSSCNDDDQAVDGVYQSHFL